MAAAALAPADRAAAAIAAGFVLAAGHAADGLPNLLTLAQGGVRLERRLRPYLNEAIHCLASALEAAMIASEDAERAKIGGPRISGEFEDSLVVALRLYLDRESK